MIVKMKALKDLGHAKEGDVFDCPLSFAKSLVRKGRAKPLDAHAAKRLNCSVAKEEEPETKPKPKQEPKKDAAAKRQKRNG